MVNKRVNRKQAPPLHLVDSINLQVPKSWELDNGIPIHCLNMGQQEIVRLKLIFPAGSWQEPKRLISTFTSKMIKEGTKSYTAEQIADTIEYYGANLSTQSLNNHAEITLYTLSKHLIKLLPVLKSMVTESVFSEKNMQAAIRKSKERLRFNLQKVDYLADEHFKGLLFGENHPYGYTHSLNDYQHINTDIVRQFYKNYYTANGCIIFIDGKIESEHLHQINRFFGQNDWLSKYTPSEPVHKAVMFQPQEVFIKKADAIQTAVRIGKPMFNKTHADYPKFFMVNTILGGYFGSRLMMNLREGKGYTYGIYSALFSMLKAGYFVISTELDNTHTKNATQEIFFEIERLQNDLVSQEELKTVRNYIMGQLLTQIDGVLNMASTIRGLYMYQLDTSFYTHLINTVKTIQPETIRLCAQQHLCTSSMTTLVVGTK